MTVNINYLSEVEDLQSGDALLTFRDYSFARASLRDVTNYINNQRNAPTTLALSVPSSTPVTVSRPNAIYVMGAGTPFSVNVALPAAAALKDFDTFTFRLVNAQPIEFTATWDKGKPVIGGFKQTVATNQSITLMVSKTFPQYIQCFKVRHLI